MNFAFANINNSFSNQAQADSLPSGMGAFENSGNPPSLFADNLNKVIKGARTPHASASAKSVAAEKNAFTEQKNLNEAKTFFLDEVDQEQGLLFLSKLQNLFLSLSGGDLSNITLDTQGLDALKEMLLKAGFEEGEVEELMSGLSEKAQDDALGLDEVMGSLFDLSADIEDEAMEEEALIESSALPFLTSILNSLGLPKETVNQIISQADRGQNGISLDVIIDHLKSIEIQSFYTGQPFQTREGDTSFSMLLEQLGLILPENMISQPGLPDNMISQPGLLDNMISQPGLLDNMISQLGLLDNKISQPGLPENMTSQPGLPENMTSQLGLSDFLASLEMRKEKIVDARKQADGLPGLGLSNQTDAVVKESSNTSIDSLFKHLEIQSAKTGLSEFFHGQIKDQFKNDLLIPDKHKPNKNGLFSQEQPVFTVKSEQFFKELESILSGKSGSAIGSGSRFKDGEEITKFSKSESVRGGESSLLSPSSGKTDSLGNALKAKATFSNMPNYVMHQVEKSIVRAVNQGENTLKIQLKPAELGRLVMTIDNVGNSMKVSITTENPVAKEILTSHVNELKTVLAAAGISLDKFDVNMNSGFRQSMNDAKNQSNNSNRKNRNKEKNSLDSINMEGLNAGTLPGAIQDGSYHFVA